MTVPRAAEWVAENDTLISRRGHRIAFRRRGTGPTVLLLHGFPTWSVKALPRAKVIELPGVGHFPSSEAPQAVVAAVRSSTV
jgi:pimeloyl-ACP methyl ester carboxylesterase